MSESIPSSFDAGVPGRLFDELSSVPADMPLSSVVISISGIAASMPLLATSKSSSSAESDFSVEALSRSFLHSCPVTSCEGSSALLTSPDNSPSCPTSSCPSAGLLVSKTLLSSTCESSLHGRTCSSDTAFSFSTTGVSVMSTSVSLLSLSTSSAIFLQLSSSLFPLSTFSDVIASMHPSLPLSSSIFFSFDCFI